MLRAFFSFSVFIGLSLSSLTAFAAPSETNRIGLYFPRIYLADVNDFDVVAKVGTNAYEYQGRALKTNDQLRYSWVGTNLNIANVSNPVPGNGYLKIYRTDDSSESNFIKNYGSSPLPLREIENKLLPGRNTVLLVLVENENGSASPATKVQISFDFVPDTPPASIEVISPAEKSLFAPGIRRDFFLKLNNFYLEKDSSNQPNKGKLEVYINESKPENLLTTLTSSITKETFSEVTFNTTDIEKIQDVPDSASASLIFVLKTSADQEVPGTRKSFPIQTNYGGSLDVGLPSIKFLSPANNTEITTTTPLKLEVKNFELLNTLDVNSQKSNTGYIQIRINDSVVIENTSKTQFTLGEFGLGSYSGVITVRADLVNQQFAFLQPQSQSSISVVMQKPQASSESNGLSVTGSNWRYIILGATILLILGSIAVLVVKG